MVVVIYTIFCDHRLRVFWGDQISLSPTDFYRRPYNTFALPCECVTSTGRPWRVDHSIMLNVTWRRFGQSAKQLEVGHATNNIWRTVVRGTWKYDDPRLNMSHEGAARLWHLQPREVLFPCPTNDCPSYVLSFDQLQKSWIIRKLKSYSPLYLHDLNTQAKRVIFGVSKTLCDFGHKNSFKKE